MSARFARSGLRQVNIGSRGRACSPRLQYSISKAPYHSYEHQQTPSFDPVEDAILAAAIENVPDQGFTARALAEGAREVGFRDATVNLFSRGAFSLVLYHLATQRTALAESDSVNSNSSDVDTNIRNITWSRLESNKALISRWQEALAMMALPSNIPASLRELGLLADEILFLSGDKSVDTSWYTKRGALSALYASTELFMTTDSSNDFQDTQDFLDRRLDAMKTAASLRGDVGTWLGVNAMGVLNGLRSKGIRI